MIFHYPAVVVKIKVSGKFRINKNVLRLNYGYGYFRVSIKPKFVKVVYLTSPAIIYDVDRVRVWRESVFLILFFTGMKIILFVN